MIVFTGNFTSVLPMLKEKKKGKGFIHSIKSDVENPGNISNTLVTWGRISEPRPHKGTSKSRTSRTRPKERVRNGTQSKKKRTLLFANVFSTINWCQVNSSIACGS